MAASKKKGSRIARGGKKAALSWDRQIAGWSVRETAVWLIKSARFVDSYHRETGEEERAELLIAANTKLRPLVFPMHEDPRRFLGLCVRQIDQLNDGLMHLAFADAIRQPKITAAVIRRLAEIFLDAGLGRGELLAFDALDRVSNGSAVTDEYEQAAIALVYLAGSSGGIASWSLYSRFKQRRGDSFRILSAVLRVVASQEPSYLGTALNAFGATLQKIDEAALEDIGAVVTDVTRRAGLDAVIFALARLSPNSYPRMFAAAFGQGRCFRLHDVLDSRSSEVLKFVSFEGSVVSIQDAIQYGGDSLWLLRVKEVSGASEALSLEPSTTTNSAYHVILSLVEGPSRRSDAVENQQWRENAPDRSLSHLALAALSRPERLN